jgi:hypothetical protein
MKEAGIGSWLTSLFGAVAGLPFTVLGYFTPGTAMALNPKWTHILLVTGGIGIVGLGFVAKAFNVHSTVAQVKQSSADVKEAAASDVVSKKL